MRGQLVIGVSDLPAVVRLLKRMLPKRGSEAPALSEAAPADAVDG